MRSTSATLLLLLLTISLSPVLGFLEGYYTTLKCNCMRDTKSFIHVRRIKYLHIYPAGSGCSNIEVVAKMRDNSSVCLNTNTKWVQRLLKVQQM
ncbi:PREDICTED: c-X-C motif chemokine 13 [Elephantulus edwardii]|uniref:c-X-C motif chemokine 13 n=1 Tax=Elephantulus edwardii TaxID=28737 RepID=UPI0003F0D088|nr:PREDICTED: c-X-C motif chemokine 13 [Elephantulus edwardii]